jgi:hypothetical protein
MFSKKSAATALIMALLVSGTAFPEPPKKNAESPPAAAVKTEGGSAANAEKNKLIEDYFQNRRSASVAFLVAYFPGLYIHGLGHSYAGNKKVYHRQLRIELISIVLMMSGGVCNNLLNPSPYGDYPLFGPGNIITGAGYALFLGNWIYDLIGAPLYCSRKNKEMEEKLNNLTFAPFLGLGSAGVMVCSRF